MRLIPSIALVTAVTFALAAGGPAAAAARLTGSTPVANGKVSNVRAVTLTFSEAVAEDKSGVEIVMTSMPGMHHHAPMTVTGFKTSMDNDRKIMTIALPRALPAGAYNVKWRVVTANAEKAEGMFSFSVK